MITYHPLTMTKKIKDKETGEEKNVYHEGALFFPFQQSGGAKLFKLKGISKPPEEPEEEITLNIKARETKTQVLIIKNWLPKK